MSTDQAFIAEAAPGVFFGNITAALNESNIITHNISTVINVSGDKLEALSNIVNTFSYALTSNELTEAELPRIREKLNTISATIADLVKNCHRVLVVCDNGKNRSALVVAYYLAKNGKRYDEIIRHIQYIYMTPEQKAAELEYVAAADRASREEIPMKTTREEMENHYDRIKKKCLTMASHQKLINAMKSTV
jgi:hypothetical protein